MVKPYEPNLVLVPVYSGPQSYFDCYVAGEKIKGLISQTIEVGAEELTVATIKSHCRVESPDEAAERRLSDIELPPLVKADDTGSFEGLDAIGFLNWMADRLVNVYDESPNVDFVIRLRDIAQRLEVDKGILALSDDDKTARPSNCRKLQALYGEAGPLDTCDVEHCEAAAGRCLYDDKPAPGADKLLGCIQAALTEYYVALNNREHGGVAAGTFVDRVQSILGRSRHGDERVAAKEAEKS